MHHDDETSPFPLHRGARRRALRVVSGEGGVIEAPEAEASLLGILLMDESGHLVSRCIAAKLNPDAFSTQAHHILAEKIFVRGKLGLPVDILVLSEEMRRDGSLAAVGGQAFLSELAAIQPTPLRFTYFLERVRDVWLTRTAAAHAKRIQDEALELTSENVGEWIAVQALKFQRMADYLLRANRDPMRDLVEKRRLHGLKVVAGEIDSSRWIYTGLSWVDAAFLPFDVAQEDWYNIIAGPPSGGKSAFMRHLALNAIDDGKRVAVFLLETSYRWIDAAAATRARVNLRQQAEWLPEQAARWSAEMERLRDVMEVQLWVFQDLFDIEDIERAIREINRMLIEKDLAAGVPPEKARGLDCVVGDYLQLMTSRDKRLMAGPREQVVSSISRSWKKLLKQLDIVGWIGAQINRDARNAGGAPKLSALRESGAIEQDADRVIFVHTPPENRAGQPQDGSNLIDEIELIQAKSRNGPKDVVVRLNFHKQFTLYTESVHKGDARPGLPKPANGFGRKEGGQS